MSELGFELSNMITDPFVLLAFFVYNKYPLKIKTKTVIFHIICNVQTP